MKNRLLAPKVESRHVAFQSGVGERLGEHICWLKCSGQMHIAQDPFLMVFPNSMIYYKERLAFLPLNRVPNHRNCTCGITVNCDIDLVPYLMQKLFEIEAFFADRTSCNVFCLSGAVSYRWLFLGFPRQCSPPYCSHPAGDALSRKLTLFIGRIAIPTHLKAALPDVRETEVFCTLQVP